MKKSVAIGCAITMTTEYYNEAVDTFTGDEQSYDGFEKCSSQLLVIVVLNDFGVRIRATNF